VSDPMLHGVRAFLRISVSLRNFHGNLHASEGLRPKIRAGLKMSHVLIKIKFKFCHRQQILTCLSNEFYMNKEWGKIQVNIVKVLSISEPV